MIQKYRTILIMVFVLAFVSNIAWEFAHSTLYVHYKGEEINNFILLRAALFDAALITLLAVPMLLVPFLRARLWIAFIVGILFAIGLEWFALSTGRWAYNDLMPVIPLINVGLTPTTQLGLIAWGIYVFLFRRVARVRL
jgi:hypothetical protein